MLEAPAHIQTSTLNVTQNNTGLFFKPAIQPKLTASKPGDPDNYRDKQEGDTMADKVMRMSDTSQKLFFPRATVQRKCAHCEEEEKKMQRKENGNQIAKAPIQTESYLSSLSGGKSLSNEERNFYEPRMGYDFSNVRLHTDSNANQSAKDVNALAYTSGSNIVFGTHQYQPGTDAGKKLLAHELTHVVQQSSSIQTKKIQRRIIVNPVNETSYVSGLLDFLCPGASATESSADCNHSVNNSCDCVCDVVNDLNRTYTINVEPLQPRPQNIQLWDNTTTVVPMVAPTPTTRIGNDPVITINSVAGRAAQFGVFDSSGRPFYIPDWRILGHELCGHGRLGQSYTGGPGMRVAHDATIDTENTIAAEHGSGEMRGHFFDVKPPGRQGESFFNSPGDPKLVFYQSDGLHYETV